MFYLVREGWILMSRILRRMCPLNPPPPQICDHAFDFPNVWHTRRYTPQRNFNWWYCCDANQWIAECCERIEEAEIRGGCNILWDMNKVKDIPRASIYLLDILSYQKSNRRSGHLTSGSGEGDRHGLSTNRRAFVSHDAATSSQASQSAFSVGRGDDERVATVAPVKAWRRHSHGSPGDKNQATGVNNNNVNLKKKLERLKKDNTGIN